MAAPPRRIERVLNSPGDGAYACMRQVRQRGPCSAACGARAMPSFREFFQHRRVEFDQIRR